MQISIRELLLLRGQSRNKKQVTLDNILIVIIEGQCMDVPIQWNKAIWIQLLI